jgi:hypothetical protein
MENENTKIESSIPRFCPFDASALVWVVVPDFSPNVYAWICPECGYTEF